MAADERSDEIDDAAPLEAVKWSFVRRCMSAVCLAHGYREVAAPPLELRGTHLMGRAGEAWPVGDDLELRSDPLVSLAQLYARSSRTSSAIPPTLTRWLLADVVFDPAATETSPHRYPAWEAVTAAVFGVEELAAEIELAIIAQRAETVLGLQGPSLELVVDPADPPRAERLRSALAELQIEFTERRDDEPGLRLSALAADGTRLVVARSCRRNGLLAALGETPAPLAGLTLSVRRAASCMPGGAEGYEPTIDVFFAALGEAARVAALAAATRERARGLRIDVELREVPLEHQRARALTSRARVIVEFAEPLDRVSVRRADGLEAQLVPRDELGAALRRLLR